ncbi:hypothetical protein AB0L82_02520 [Nocardia sp. NPDC052001]|uniref:hypothetical protein n=1 Tax=Nocardia sp. NPDC052001 TaxID=3154853 RepID=UPI00343BC30F
MTRERPIDDDASGTGDDYAGDTAYQIANGVARTARAGAYVTGGALIASAGTRSGDGPAPAIDHDSRNVSWQQANDPQPDVPSPTLTFPDLTADQLPPAHLPTGMLPVATQDNQHYGTDAGLLPADYGSQPSADTSMSGFNGVGIPDTDLPLSFRLPDYQQQPGYELPNGGGPVDSNQPWDPQQPGNGDSEWQLPDTDGSGGGWQIPGADGSGWQLPGADGSGWHIPGADGGGGFGWQMPGGDGGHGWQIPGGFKLPGADGHLPGMGNLPGAGDPIGSGSHGGIFDGIGDGPVGIAIDTNWAVNMHVGLDGVHFESNLQVNIGVGNVGHQLDQFTQDMGQGIGHIPNGIDPNGNPLPAGSAPWGSDAVNPGAQTTGANLPGQQPNSATASATDPHGPGAGVPGAGIGAPGAHGGGTGSHGTGYGSHGAGSGAPLGGSTGAPGTAPGSSFGLPAGGTGAPAPAYVAPAAPAPIATPVAPAAPIVVAPVVPAAVAPVVVAPVAVAQPVVATPLQTTIQPDAAQHPIANLLTTPSQSPLYASAAQAPALFEHHGNHPVLLANGGHPDVSTIAKPTPVTTEPGTTVPKISVPPKTDPALTTVPSVPVTTKIPGITDPTTTKLPGITLPTTTAPHTTAPHTTVPPVTTDPDTGTTRPNTGGDTDGHSTAPTITPPSDTVPTHQPPVTNPSHPSSDATVPTVAPTVPPVTLDPPAATVPAVPTGQPQTNPPKPQDAPKPAKPIAEVNDSGQHLMPIADDSALHPVYLMHDGGLGSHLITDGSLTDSHFPVHAAFDHTLL